MQLNSHSYSSLLALKDRYPDGWAFNHTGSDVVSAANSDGNCEYLTIIGQALSLHILFGVQHKLSDFLAFNSFHFHPLSERFGECVVVAQVNTTNREKLAQALSDVSGTYHVDLALQSQQPRLHTPGLLVMDMDSTVIQIECIDEIAKLAGVGEKVSAVTEQAMRGELDFKESLIARVACLEGVENKKLETIRDNIPLMPGLTTLIHILKANQWKLVIASGGFTYFADYLKQRLGLDAIKANELAHDESRLSGKVDGTIVDAAVKADTVLDYAKQWGIERSQTVAMGDGANDLLMMQAASLGVAYHAKPIVEHQADVAVRFGGLHTLLYFLS